MSAMRHRRGFTLIEILIVVAVIGILAAIAYPAYQDQVRKSRRGQLKADLTELAQILERNFTEANRYDQNSAGVALTIGTLPLFNQSPRTGTANYTITLITLPPPPTPASTFTLTAVPTGAQAGDPCGTYTLNQAGTKTATGPADCW
ncbi:MAG: type IV pilin protein [Gammaproteobacteria bacterium]